MNHELAKLEHLAKILTNNSQKQDDTKYHHRFSNQKSVHKRGEYREFKRLQSTRLCTFEPTSNNT